MFGLGKYNYESFRKARLMKDFVMNKFGSAPEPGERAPDFELRTLDGDEIQLSDFKGEKNVVLTFGSATCPLTAGSIGALNDLYDEFNGDDVQFLFVYVREAHPGEDLPAHESYDDKVRAAELFREEDEVTIPILVDEVNGRVHRKYGKLPNPTFLIDKSGRIAFRALTTRADVIEEALEELLERQEERGVEHAIVRGGQDVHVPSLRSLVHAHRALERGGDRSLREFREEFGTPGRVTLAASRVIEPVALNPGKAIAGAMLAGGVIVGALFAGRALRNRRYRVREPYEAQQRGLRPTGTADAEPVGI